MSVQCSSPMCAHSLSCLRSPFLAAGDLRAGRGGCQGLAGGAQTGRRQALIAPCRREFDFDTSAPYHIPASLCWMMWHPLGKPRSSRRQQRRRRLCYTPHATRAQPTRKRFPTTFLPFCLTCLTASNYVFFSPRITGLNQRHPLSAPIPCLLHSPCLFLSHVRHTDFADQYMFKKFAVASSPHNVASELGMQSFGSPAAADWLGSVQGRATKGVGIGAMA